jgi:putative colanic acid biosynthesis acetyltransferase WcaF
MTDDALTTIPTTRPNPSPHTLGNRIGRALWGIVQSTLFRCSPKPCFRWRALLLRCFGASVHPKARVYPRARIWYPKNLTLDRHATLADDVDCYCVAPVTIGESTTISQYTFLCAATHDFDVPEFPLVPLPITIGSRVWIAADCFIAPGVTIPDGVVIGARSSVFKDPEPWGVYAGSPAKRLRERGFGPGSSPKHPADDA